jgi:SpoVK/Ycf46/Vps4 family AAA+-type ATPase
LDIYETDIGGLDPVIEELRESVIYPLTFLGYSPTSQCYCQFIREFCSTLWSPWMRKNNVESGVCFINLHSSTLTENWHGDSNKLVTAIFSLAKNLPSTIMFIDKIDAVLRSRSSTDHEASTMVQAGFMTRWDGLLSTNSSETTVQIMILGATNIIQDIDEAILRRMPKTFPINLPDIQCQPQRAWRPQTTETLLGTSRYGAIEPKSSIE